MSKDYITQLESRNEQLASDLEKMAKELEEAKDTIKKLTTKSITYNSPYQPIYSNGKWDIK